jgi:hypothetical protein
MSTGERIHVRTSDVLDALRCVRRQAAVEVTNSTGSRCRPAGVPSPSTVQQGVRRSRRRVDRRVERSITTP